MTHAEEQCRFFVQTWAEAVMRQVERVREVRKEADRLGNAFERMEDWSPDQFELERNFREQWAGEHSLIWASHQLEQWAARLARERGQEPAPKDEVLARLRDALEHLDDAQFKDGDAVPGAKGNRSLRKLPGERLAIALGTGDSPAFNLIDPAELERRALAVVSTIEDELMQAAADWLTEMSTGR